MLGLAHPNTAYKRSRIIKTTCRRTQPCNYFEMLLIGSPVMELVLTLKFKEIKPSPQKIIDPKSLSYTRYNSHDLLYVVHTAC